MYKRSQRPISLGHLVEAEEGRNVYNGVREEGLHGPLRRGNQTTRSRHEKGSGNSDNAKRNYKITAVYSIAPAS